MTVIKILDIKDFTSKLFLGNVFDPFPLVDAHFVTGCIYSIDGHLQSEYFDTDENRRFTDENRQFVLWNDMKAYARSIIKGKRLPVQFRLLFKIPWEILDASADVDPSLDGYLNIQYKNNEIICSADVHANSFTPFALHASGAGEAIMSYFRQKEIVCQVL